MNNKKLEEINELLNSGKVNEAKQEFSKILPDESVEYLLLNGKIEQKFQHWGNAVNAFSKVIEIDSENKEAKNNLEIIQNILNFWNPEMFNP